MKYRIRVDGGGHSDYSRPEWSETALQMTVSTDSTISHIGEVAAYGQKNFEGGKTMHAWVVLEKETVIPN